MMDLEELASSYQGIAIDYDSYEDVSELLLVTLEVRFLFACKQV